LSPIFCRVSQSAAPKRHFKRKIHFFPWRGLALSPVGGVSPSPHDAPRPNQTFRIRRCVPQNSSHIYKGATTGGRGGRTPPPPEIWTDHPKFLRSCTLQCTKLAIPSNHPYFVMYNNLDQGIGPPNFENVVAPLHIYADGLRKGACKRDWCVCVCRCLLGRWWHRATRLSAASSRRSECVCCAETTQPSPSGRLGSPRTTRRSSSTSCHAPGRFARFRG